MLFSIAMGFIFCSLFVSTIQRFIMFQLISYLREKYPDSSLCAYFDENYFKLKEIKDIYYVSQLKDSYIDNILLRCTRLNRVARTFFFTSLPILTAHFIDISLG